MWWVSQRLIVSQSKAPAMKKFAHAVFFTLASLIITVCGSATFSYAQQPAPGRITSMAPLDEESDLSRAVREFRGTQIFENENRERGQHLAYELGTVLTYQEVPGHSVIIPVVDNKGKPAGSYYLYNKSDKIERGNVIESPEKQRLAFREPGTKKEIDLIFDDMGRFKEAKTIASGVSEWDCIKQGIERSPGLASLFTGSICSACLTAKSAIPCIGCIAIVGGMFLYSLFTCT